MSNVDVCSDSTWADSSDAINVLIAYDDLVAAQRAMQLFSRVGQAHTGDFICEPLPWRFDLLADPDWGRCAATDALRAHLIVITTSKRAELPAQVQSWLSECLVQKRGVPGAIVALLAVEEDAGTASCQSLDFLRSIAREAGMDFFVPISRPSGIKTSVEETTQQFNRVTLVAHDVNPLSPPQTTSRRGPAPSHLARHDYGYRHWGINE